MTMEIQLLDTEGKFLCILNNEDALLGAYPVDDNMRLHVSISLLCTSYATLLSGILYHGTSHESLDCIPRKYK